MKKIYKKLSIGLLSIIGITGLAYGAGVTISNFNQTVGSGDIINEGWYNGVNTLLKGSYNSTEGSICQYSGGSYVCALSPGSVGGGGGGGGGGINGICENSDISSIDPPTINTTNKTINVGKEVIQLSNSDCNGYTILGNSSTNRVILRSEEINNITLGSTIEEVIIEGDFGTYNIVKGFLNNFEIKKNNNIIVKMTADVGQQIVGFALGYRGTLSYDSTNNKIILTSKSNGTSKYYYNDCYDGMSCSHRGNCKFGQYIYNYNSIINNNTWYGKGVEGTSSSISLDCK